MAEFLLFAVSSFLQGLTVGLGFWVAAKILKAA